MEKKLFIGIKIVPSGKLIEVYQELKELLDNEKIKWVPFQNMHITLKFLGNTPEYLIPEINKAIGEIVNQHKPFNFKIKGLGYFIKSHKIKVIWMGIEDGSGLNAFAANLISKFESIGYENENRKYTPHLTLGRVNLISDINKVEELITNKADLFIQDVEVREIVLFESIIKYDGPHYHIIETFSLIE